MYLYNKSNKSNKSNYTHIEKCLVNLECNVKQVNAHVQIVKKAV